MSVLTDWLRSGWETSNVLSYVFAFLLVLYISRRFLKNWQLPPGPFGFPLIGNLHLLDSQLEVSLAKLQKKYGDIFSITVGQRLVIVLNSWELIKETFVKHSDIFSGRPSDNMLSAFYERNNVLSTDGEAFNIQKRFLLSSLRDYGLGKLSLEGKIQTEAEAVMNIFRERNGQPMDVQVPFNIMTTNVICAVAFGERFEYEDKRMKLLIDYMAKIMKLFGEPALIEAFPLLRYLPDKWNGLEKLRKMKKQLENFIEEIFEDHIKTFDKNHLRDVIDDYLQKMDAIGKKSNDKESRDLFSRRNVIQNLLLTFIAGTDTTANTLSWAVKILINHPEVQEKIQKEIDAVVGRSRLPSWTDRSQLPFTEATIHEIHRISTIVPINVAHSNTEEFYLKGYRIPKRTDILTNLWSVHYDSKLWKNPEKFDPSRFLDNNGKAFKPEYLIPFSVGKRACLGEPLAKMEVFIFLASFLQNFTFRCKGKIPDYSQAIFGIVRKPTPFEVIVEPRM